MDPLRTEHQLPDGTLPFAERLKIAVPAAILCAGTYELAGKPVVPPIHPAGTWIDQVVPFVPWTIWLYMPTYVLCFALVLLFVKHGRMFRATAFSLVLFNLIAVPFFVTMPVLSPRPVLNGDLTGNLALIHHLYLHDTPYNTFPSLHVACSTFIAYVLFKADKRVGVLGWMLSACIWVSVLTTKQHWSADVLGGWVLAGVGVAAWHAVLPLEKARVERVLERVLKRVRVRD